jgi:integrase/recombinase XerC
MNTSKAVELFIQSCRARGLSPNTVRWYGGILLWFAIKYTILPSTPEACETFILSCQGGDERRHGYYRALNAFYRYTENRLNIPNNPMDKISPPRVKPKLPRPISAEQLNQLLMFPHKERVVAMLLFLSDTGVRLGELVSLAPNDVVETYLGYIASVTGKTGARLVPFSPMTFTAINKYLPLNISRSRASHIIKQAFVDAHVPGSALNLRHTFGTLWNGDIDILQRIMGHSKISTTMRYRKLHTEDISKAHNINSPLKRVLPLMRSMV